MVQKLFSKIYIILTNKLINNENFINKGENVINNFINFQLKINYNKNLI